MNQKDSNYKWYTFNIQADRNEIQDFCLELISQNNPDANIKEFVYKGNKSISNEYYFFLYPCKGRYSIIYNGYQGLIVFTISDKVYQLSFELKKYEEILISFYTETYQKALELMRDFIYRSLKNFDNKNSLINIYVFGEYQDWQLFNRIHKRDMKTIINKDKERIIQDIQKFFDSYNEYEKYGMPHKRVYLLYGPPGTGKTSFIYSLASTFNKNIALISHCEKNFISEYNIFRAVSQIPDNTILVFEDIDLLISKHFKEHSGLLNILDGLMSKRSLLIFMTTNRIEEIPYVVRRPGRVDMIIEFKLCDQFFINESFELFGRKHLADKFCDVINKDKITPSALIKFLFETRDLPDSEFIKRKDTLKTIIEETKEKRYDFYS